MNPIFKEDYSWIQEALNGKLPKYLVVFQSISKKFTKGPFGSFELNSL